MEALFHPEPILEVTNGKHFHVLNVQPSLANERGKRLLCTPQSEDLRLVMQHLQVNEVVDAVGKVKTADEARDGSITAAFEHIGKGAITYSHRQFTKTEARYITGLFSLMQWSANRNFSAEFVQWISESKRPFEIVNNRGFQRVMKTGHPHCQ